MTRAQDVDQLVRETLEHPIEGWDFGWLKGSGRIIEDLPPWDYAQMVTNQAAASPELLDLGTGGGERLAAIAHLPSRTLATEAYRPNVAVAARRLRPLGVQVVEVHAALDNALQTARTKSSGLPFRDGALHLVIDRNEAFVASEVARILVSGGVFLTEQFAGDEPGAFARLLEIPSEATPRWNLSVARRQVVRAGLRFREGRQSRVSIRFCDVGALAWYLKAVPWAAPGFSFERHAGRLVSLQRRISREGPIEVRRSVFWLRATKD